METSSNALLAKRGRAEDFDATKVAMVFEQTRQIHIERGASLDRASTSAIVAARKYLGTETVPDRICKKVVADARAEQEELLATHDERLRELHSRSDLTDDERLEMQEMFRALERAVAKVRAELSRCPSAYYATTELPADVEGS